MQRDSTANVGKNPAHSIMLPQLKQELAYVDDAQLLQMSQAAKTHQRQLSGSNGSDQPAKQAGHPNGS